MLHLVLIFNTVTTTAKFTREEYNMAKARLVTVLAIAEWAKVFDQNRDMEGYGGKYKETNGACTIDLILDEDNLDKLMSAGCSKVPKADPEGRGKKIRIDRKFDTGFDWSSGSPIVTKADGTPWVLDEDGLIGNGSKVQVDVTIYDTQYGNSGSRLDKVVVTNHIPYGVDTKPAPSASAPPLPDNIEDEILF